MCKHTFLSFLVRLCCVALGLLDEGQHRIASPIFCFEHSLQVLIVSIASKGFGHFIQVILQPLLIALGLGCPAGRTQTT